MSPELRKQLELDAQDERLSLQEIVRSILCAHYDLDCTPKSGTQRADQWNGAATVLLKNMQPELFSAIKEDAAETGKSMRSLILEALESHYQGVERDRVPHPGEQAPAHVAG